MNTTYINTTYIIIGIVLFFMICNLFIYKDSLTTHKESFVTYKEASQLALDINKWINEVSQTDTDVTFSDYLEFTKGKIGISYNLLKPETFYKMLAYKKDNKLTPSVIDEFAK